MEIGLPHVRTLVHVEKTSQKKSSSEDPIESSPYYLSSHHPRCAEFFAELIRGHWAGCEIRNHWVRDALFEEDKTRSKNPNLNGNLAVLRCSLIALKAALAPNKSWPFIRELSSMKISLPYNLVCKNLFK
jgi:predicted transposase YbfD/YdcC